MTGGSTDGYLRVWNLHDDNPRARTNWPFANIFAIEVVPHDGNPVIACEGRNHDIMLWDLVRNASIQPQLEGHDRTIYVLRSAKLNGKTVLASAGADGTIRLWDIGTGKAHRAPIKTGVGIAALAFGRWQGGTALVSGGLDGRVSIWNPENGQLLAGPHATHTGGINTIVVGTMGGQTIGVSGGADSALVLWRPDGEVVTRIDLDAWVMAIKSIDRDRIVAGTAKGLVAISFSGVTFGDL
jgi:WD40 repeat protein